MPKYKVIVEWTMCATVEVDAENEEYAIVEADSMDHLPKDGDYMDGSYRALDVLEEVKEEE